VSPRFRAGCEAAARRESARAEPLRSWRADEARGEGRKTRAVTGLTQLRAARCGGAVPRRLREWPGWPTPRSPGRSIQRARARVRRGRSRAPPIRRAKRPGRRRGAAGPSVCSLRAVSLHWAPWELRFDSGTDPARAVTPDGLALGAARWPLRQQARAEPTSDRARNRSPAPTAPLTGPAAVQRDLADPPASSARSDAIIRRQCCGDCARGGTLVRWIPGRPTPESTSC
jgi:hypothetical protein